MQVTINVPDNLPKAFILREIKAFEEKLRKAHGDARETVEDDELKINVQACLEAFEKIKKGDKSGLTEIGDIDEYIENLKNEIN